MYNSKLLNWKPALDVPGINPSITSIFLCSCLALTAVGCSDSSTISSDQANIDILSPTDLDAYRAINRDLLSVQMTMDDQQILIEPNSTNTLWTGSFQLPVDRAVELTIEWTHDGLLIARDQRRLGPTTETITLTLGAGDYVTEGTDFDADNDSISNIQELRNSTNPRDNLNIDIVIPKVAENETPGINGQYGILWEAKPIVDWQGNALIIDNLMIDRGADRLDGATGFNWQALHDGTSLYLVVFGEDATNETPRADSSIGTRDDSLNIYIDGNNSKTDTYDGVDDRHIIVPLLKLLKPAIPTTGVSRVLDENLDLAFDAEGNILVESAGEQFYVPVGVLQDNNSTDADGRIQRGSNSLPLPTDYRFANQRHSDGRHVFELRFNMAELGIEIGKPFGIEVQMDDDNDGGDRDARYGWKHPSRDPVSDSDTNNTAMNPSYMGTAILE